MKILILSNLVSYTYNFRKEIIEDFVASGNEVIIACENDNDKKWMELKKLCQMVPVYFNGKGTNIKEEYKLLTTYRRFMKESSPDIVISYTIKMNLYGGMAAKWRRIPYVPMITGLGELEKKGKLRTILLFMHRYVMPTAKCVIFQNEDNRRFFEENGIKTRKTLVLPGSGINLKKFVPCAYPEDDVDRLAFVGRLTVAKGIKEYLDAAEALASPTREFYAAGKCDPEYQERVDALSKSGKLHYLGILPDSRTLMAKMSCLVLPTFHPEGISNVILEANATERPVICTNRTGCKEIVSDGVNGLFCEAKDSENLIQAIEKFCVLPHDKKVSMGKKGRLIVEKNFDRAIIVKAYRELIK